MIKEWERDSTKIFSFSLLSSFFILDDQFILKYPNSFLSYDSSVPLFVDEGSRPP